MSSFFKKNRVSKPNCPKCKLDKQCNSPRMQVSGKGAKGILIITNEPSVDEDKTGFSFMDEHGMTLQAEMKLAGINVQEDCWVVHAVGCRTKINSKGKTTEPTAPIIEACRPKILGVVQDLKPTKIVLVGNIALASFYGDRNKQCTSISKMNGLKLWDATYKAWVYPLWHPHHIKKFNWDGLLESEWRRCINRIAKDSPKPLRKKWNKVTIYKYFDDIIAALKKCLSTDTLIAIDYETTGLSMYKEGHSTVSFAWANSEGAYSIPVQHPSLTLQEQEVVLTLLRKILNKRKIKKIVQGITFEYPWTKAQIKSEPRSFFWDTQLATHVLDNRTGVTGLKFQCFVRWGVEEYDTMSKLYIKSDKATGYNNMLKMPIDALLTYNGCDVLYTYALYEEQLQEFVGNELEAYHFLHAGAITLCELSDNGISIKEEYYHKQRALLEKERDALIEGITFSEEAHKYRRQFGEKFDYNSPKDLQKMLFEVLKLKPIKETKTGYSTDEEVLTKIDISLTRDIIATRKLNKMIGTYVDGFLEHTYDGMMHPSFSLSRARTYRSSSQWPNFQNVPKRDPKAKKITRSGMVPRIGRVLGEMDFSGAEISTSCYYHLDPTFIKYQTDGGGDMHKDACAEILKIKPEQVPGEARQATKGIWTFAQFYGSYYANCAKQGWEEYPLLESKNGGPCMLVGTQTTVADHFKKTFHTLKAFEAHLKKFEDKFWKEWFPIYTRWKAAEAAKYKKTGFVETFLGFRFKGEMDAKKCSNYPIQGTSFHLLLHTATAVIKELKKRGLKTLAIGQIHDSLILDIPVEELDEVQALLNNIVANLHNTFPWMTFPMGLDFEVSESYENGGSFASMHKV